MQTRLASTLQRSSCLCLLGAGIKGEHSSQLLLDRDRDYSREGLQKAPGQDVAGTSWPNFDTK